MTRLAVRVLTAVTGLALLGGTAGCGMFGGSEQKTLTAHFDRTIGLYVHSDVRVLGVRIGEVTAIKPEGKTVRVDMKYDAKYKLPVDAKAVVVSPSIVSDRYVQVTPVWRSGESLPTSYDLPVERTAVPVELDAIYSALDELNRAIGPHGANKNGALSRLLDVSAQNLKGNGELLNTTLDDLSKAVETLAGSREQLFGTVDSLQDFTTTVATSDATVRRFNSDLADVAAQLSGERQDLATAVRQLSIALGEVATFVRDNKAGLTANVRDLASITGTLVKQKKALEEFLDNSAVALGNLQLAYNPKSGTLDTRDNNSNQTDQNTLLCAIFTAVSQPCPALSTLGAAR
jgi:phospholipid/cholesterol/gamma-HCH transport system substrate-binding protein